MVESVPDNPLAPIAQPVVPGGFVAESFPVREALRSPFRAPAVRMLETRLSIEGRVLPDTQVTLRTPGDSAKLVHQILGDADREQFIALYLNARHVVTHVHTVSQGTLQSAPVHPREVFKGAVLANASALVVAHNHPSGDIRPSDQDNAITERLREAGELLGIELLDSLIVGPVDSFYSTAEGGVGRLEFSLPTTAT